MAASGTSSIVFKADRRDIQFVQGIALLQYGAAACLAAGPRFRYRAAGSCFYQANRRLELLCQ